MSPNGCYLCLRSEHVAGDFNGDGHTDLAVANTASGDVSVLLGNGEITFQYSMK